MFFQTFFQMMSPGVDYNLTLSRTDGKLTVLVMPKVGGLKDAAQHNLVPFTLTGAPDEIDRGFFPALQQPLPKAAALLTNMAEYEKQADKAAANSKATKDEKSKADKAAKDKKDKYDGFMKKAGESETAGNLDDTLTQLQQARLHATDKALKTVDEKIAALKAKMGQGDLFGIPAAVPAPPQPAAVSVEPVQEQAVPSQEAIQPIPRQEAQPIQPMQPAAQPTPQQETRPVQQSPQQAPQPAGQPQPVSNPVPQPQPAQPSMYPPVQGAGMFGAPEQPQPGYQPAPGQPAGQQPPQGWPVYPQAPQGGQPGYGAGMFGMAPGYGQGYPRQGTHEQPHGNHGGAAPDPGFMSAGDVYNPADYADIPDVQFTHVGQAMNQPHQTL